MGCQKNTWVTPGGGQFIVILNFYLFFMFPCVLAIHISYLVGSNTSQVIALEVAAARYPLQGLLGSFEVYNTEQNCFCA